MNEKKQNELSTAEAFLELYNSKNSTSYSIVKHDDTPDFQCKDQESNKLNLEITLSQDREKDIQAALGRSNSRNFEKLKRHIEDVKAGKANPLEGVSCSHGSVLEMMVKCIEPKLKKDYGSNVALVIRHVSGIFWKWHLIEDQIKERLDLSRNTFAKGIWIISNSLDEIYRLI